MKRLILKIFLFILFSMCFFYIVIYNVDGYTDPFYLRFTTQKQENLILGTSRAAQGLIPSVFGEVLKKKFYNYSFTIAHSPFGPTYLKSIINKLRQDTKDGIFIISVTPWSISSVSKFPDDITKFRENNLCVGNTDVVNIYPNMGYLINNMRGNYYKVFLNKYLSPMYLHDDGWLEVSLNMDEDSVNNRTKYSIKSFKRNLLPTYKYSEKRLEYLIKTIEMLKGKGRVYLVRLPIQESLMDIENEFMPDFDSRLEKAISISDGYLDMKSYDNLTFTDGNHLYKESGKELSKILANNIKQKLL